LSRPEKYFSDETRQSLSHTGPWNDHAAAAPAPVTAETLFECYAHTHDGCFLPAGEPPCSDETYQFFLAACDAEAKDADARNFSFSAPKGLSQPERSKFMQMKRFMARKGLR